MIDSTVHAAAVAGLETALNRALALDPGALAALGQLQGTVFHLHCTDPELALYLLPGTEGVRLAGRWEGDVTTTIKGAAKDFAELAGSSDPAAALINGNLELHGDSAPMLELQGIIKRLNMDWEAPLVEVFGDVVGHQLAAGFRGLFSWSRAAIRSIERQVTEFITEEARLTPPRRELEDFYQDVEQLNLRVEKLARILHQLPEIWRRKRAI